MSLILSVVFLFMEYGYNDDTKTHFYIIMQCWCAEVLSKSCHLIDDKKHGEVTER